MPKKAEPALFEDGELAPVPEKILEAALAVFNEIVAKVNLAEKATIWRGAKALTDARRKRLKVAVQDCGGLIGWRSLLEGAARNGFLLGKEGRTAAHRNWTPDLDFFIQPKTVVKLVEGAYAPAIDTPKRLHIPMAYQPPHLKPAAPFVPEPREVRLAALVVSYRKVGKWADANRVEEELAKLENRPPVLVPAPDWKAPPAQTKPSPPARNPAPVTDLDGWDMVPE